MTHTKRVCENCGKEIDVRGYNTHLKACFKKGKKDNKQDKGPVETQTTPNPTEPKEPPIQTTNPAPKDSKKPQEYKPDKDNDPEEVEEFKGFFV